MTRVEIDAILKQARSHNGETDITGVLFYLEGNFLQLLEGEDPALSDTYLRIKTDPRHHNLIQLVDENIAERSFPDWPMGFRGVTEGEMRDNPDLFARENGHWTVRDEAAIGPTIKIILDTFLKVNDGRRY